MSQIASNGGQPQKQPKYAPIYQGRFYNGINTNRSPLRAASASHLQEKFYSDNSGDALIAGSNLEVSNRLTLVRRPGNPKYDTTHTYNTPDAFDDFRVNKANSDVFGTTLESIYTMIDEGGTTTTPNYLYSLDASFNRGGDSAYYQGLKFKKTQDPTNSKTTAGQSYMQAVGNSLYFANGVQNKKWLTSLFTRTSSGNATYLQGSNGLAGTYPFGTYLIDSVTGNPQEFIGISIGKVTNVVVASNTLTLTVSLTDDTRDYTAGATFQLWGLKDNSWLNGYTLTLSSSYDHTASPHHFVAAVVHADASTAETSTQAFIIQNGTVGEGTTPYVALTGNSVPTYGTTKPSSAVNTNYGIAWMGDLTLDGNTVWMNHGVSYGDSNQPNVMNWGIQAPTTKPTYSASGSSVSWAANTYYSPASVFIDSHGNMWQVSTAGKTGNSAPFTVSPTAQTKVVINSVYSDGTHLFFQTDTQSLAAGDTVILRNMLACGPNVNGTAVTPNLDGLALTVDATGLTTTAFRVTHTVTAFGSSSHRVKEYGQAVVTGGSLAPTIVTETVVGGGGASWTCIHLAAALTWKAHTHYNVGDFIVSPSNNIFQLGPKTQPWVYGSPDLYYFPYPNSRQTDWKGAVLFFNASDPNIFAGDYKYGSGSFASPTHVSLSSLWLQRQSLSGDTSTPFQQSAINGAGEVGALSTIGVTPAANWDGVITATVFIPRPGSYTFTTQHNDGMFYSFDSAGVSAMDITVTSAVGGAYKKSGSASNVPQSITPKLGYGATAGGGASNLSGDNNSGTSGPGPFNQTAENPADSSQWYFPQAGSYGIEISFAKWYHAGGFMIVMSPGSGAAPQNALAVGEDETGTSQPSWAAFTKTGASYDLTYDVIVWGGKNVEVQSAGQQYLWNNLGPKSDFVWVSGKNYTLPGTSIIDPNGNQQFAYETGITGSTAPTTWSTTIGGITADTSSTSLSWINAGSISQSAITGSTISALSTQGYIYWIALVNTLDETVSNVGPVSSGTGGFVNGKVVFGPGAGLDTNTIDPQADYVAIFRSVDGGSTPFLIPGFVNSPFTVPLAQYMAYGYVDTVTDAELNNLVQGANAQENTPPAVGAKNLTYHLSRIWYSIGDTVYWTSGPLAPVGNGTDGSAPSNFASCSSQIRRLVPVAIGMLVFTVSDVYIIAGNGTATNPILPAIPYLTGVGLANYNALDVNGGLIGFFTTDKQFVMFDPSAGLHYVGFNIGDQFRLNNGKAGQSWDTTKVYVASHISGEDQAWYVADGVNGWYKLISTPAPEQGSVSWSPFSTIAGSGAGPIKSVETSPGVHNLLTGQVSSTAAILYRNLDATTDAGSDLATGTAYAAYGVIGSIVLAQPGQVAKLSFITTDSVNVGSPLTIGVIIDEALPYFKGSFDILKHWVNDPPNLPPSSSILSQRFYLAENTKDAAYCRHLQILVQWPAEAAQNELQTLTIFGAYEVEQ